MDPRDKTSSLAERVARKVDKDLAGVRLDELLASKLAVRDLNTLLLNAWRARAKGRSFGEVRDEADRLPMTQASSVDARALHALDSAAYDAAATFEAIEVAPVLPLGAAAMVGVHPNNVLGALRMTEVVGDPTVAMALEAGRRRRGPPPRADVRLCASHRCLRLQPNQNPAFSPHFRLFALTTATRSEGDVVAAERRVLLQQLLVWVELFRVLRDRGAPIARLRVTLSDTAVVRAALAKHAVDPERLRGMVTSTTPERTDDVLRGAGAEIPRAVVDVGGEPFARTLPDAARTRLDGLVRDVGAVIASIAYAPEVVYDLGRLQGLGYYEGPMLQLTLVHDDGREISIGDGGAVRWLSELLSDRRERFVATGIGSELFVKLFTATGPNGTSGSPSPAPGEGAGG